MLIVDSTRSARKASCTLRQSVFSWLREVSRAYCCVIVEPPSRTPPPREVAPRRPDKPAQVDAPVAVEAPVLDRHDRLGEMRRQVGRGELLAAEAAARGEDPAVIGLHGDRPLAGLDHGAAERRQGQRARRAGSSASARTGSRITAPAASRAGRRPRRASIGGRPTGRTAARGRGGRIDRCAPDGRARLGAEPQGRRCASRSARGARRRVRRRRSVPRGGEEVARRAPGLPGRQARVRGLGGRARPRSDGVGSSAGARSGASGVIALRVPGPETSGRRRRSKPHPIRCPRTRATKYASAGGSARDRVDPATGSGPLSGRVGIVRPPRGGCAA